MRGVSLKAEKLGPFSLDSLLPTLEDLKALKRFRDLFLILIRKAEHEEPLISHCHRDKEDGCDGCVVREIFASEDDQRTWAELRSIWKELYRKHYDLLPLNNFNLMHLRLGIDGHGALSQRDYIGFSKSLTDAYNEPEQLQAQLHAAVESSAVEPTLC